MHKFSNRISLLIALNGGLQTLRRQPDACTKPPFACRSGGEKRTELGGRSYHVDTVQTCTVVPVSLRKRANERQTRSLLFYLFSIISPVPSHTFRALLTRHTPALGLGLALSRWYRLWLSANLLPTPACRRWQSTTCLYARRRRLLPRRRRQAAVGRHAKTVEKRIQKNSSLRNPAHASVNLKAR